MHKPRLSPSCKREHIRGINSVPQILNPSIQSHNIDKSIEINTRAAKISRDDQLEIRS